MPPALVRKRCFRADDRLRAGRRRAPASALHPRDGAVPEGLERAAAAFRRSAFPPTARSRTATVETWGPNWRVATDYHYFRWDDIVSADAPESDCWRFPLGVAALIEFILTGTAVKYFVVAWRYGGFFLSPLIYILGMIWLSIGLTRLVVGHSGLPYSLFWAPLACVRALRGAAVDLRPEAVHPLCARRLVLRARLHSSRAAGASRSGSTALRRNWCGIARETDADEIIVDGHSLGAPLSLVVVDRALKLDPELGRARQAAAPGFERLLAAQGRAASGRRLAARGRGAGWRTRRDLLGRVSRRSSTSSMSTRSIRSWRSASPATGKPIVKIIRIRRWSRRQPTGASISTSSASTARRDGQRAALLLRLLHALLRADPAAPSGSTIGDAAVSAFAGDGALIAAVSQRGGAGSAATELDAVTATISKILWLVFGIVWFSATAAAGTALAQDADPLLRPRYAAKSCCSAAR